jgi:hypothetical protein
MREARASWIQYPDRLLDSLEIFSGRTVRLGIHEPSNRTKRPPWCPESESTVRRPVAIARQHLSRARDAVAASP